jgi:HSP20 family protein
MFNITNILEALNVPTYSDKELEDYYFSSSVKESLSDNENSFIIELELPGISKESIGVDIEGDALKVTAVKTKAGKVGNLSDNRKYGSFSKTYHIKTTVKKNDISAEYKDGILTITIPKDEKAKPKKIKIT